MGLEWRLEETELQDEVGDWVVEKLLVQRLVWVGILGDRAVQTGPAFYRPSPFCNGFFVLLYKDVPG